MTRKELERKLKRKDFFVKEYDGELYIVKICNFAAYIKGDELTYDPFFEILIPELQTWLSGILEEFVATPIEER